MEIGISVAIIFKLVKYFVHGALERCLNGFATKCYKQKKTII